MGEEAEEFNDGPNLASERGIRSPTREKTAPALNILDERNDLTAPPKQEIPDPCYTESVFAVSPYGMTIIARRV